MANLISLEENWEQEGIEYLENVQGNENARNEHLFDWANSNAYEVVELAKARLDFDTDINPLVAAQYLVATGGDVEETINALLADVGEPVNDQESLNAFARNR